MGRHRRDEHRQRRSSGNAVAVGQGCRLGQRLSGDGNLQPHVGHLGHLGAAGRRAIRGNDDAASLGRPPRRRWQRQFGYAEVRRDPQPFGSWQWRLRCLGDCPSPTHGDLPVDGQAAHRGRRERHGCPRFGGALLAGGGDGQLGEHERDGDEARRPHRDGAGLWHGAGGRWSQRNCGVLRGPDLRILQPGHRRVDRRRFDGEGPPTPHSHPARFGRRSGGRRLCGLQPLGEFRAVQSGHPEVVGSWQPRAGAALSHGHAADLG